MSVYVLGAAFGVDTRTMEMPAPRGISDRVNGRLLGLPVVGDEDVYPGVVELRRYVADGVPQ